MNFLSHLECGLCGEILEAQKVWNLCPKCSKPLLARYDLEAAKKSINRETISRREGFTPLHHAQRLGKELGFANLYIKDEGLNPTGSFKARGLCAATVTGFKHLLRQDWIKDNETVVLFNTGSAHKYSHLWD